MNNQEIAKLFRNVAAALIIDNANRFRIIAYEKAAESIEQLSSDIKEIWKQRKLNTIPGIGETISNYLNELFTTGHIKHLEVILNKVSPAVFLLLDVPGLGPKRADFLTSKLHLNDPKTVILGLKKAIKQNKIAKFDGWGEKSQSELAKSIESFEKGHIKENRMVLSKADMWADKIIFYLNKVKGVVRVDVLGSLRRKLATIGDIDIAVATNCPQDTIKAFVSFPSVSKIVDQGEKGATIKLIDGRQADLRVQSPKSYGAMLQYFTGSKAHNIHLRELALKKGLSLSEHGIKLVHSSKLAVHSNKFNKKLGIYEFDNEEEFYKTLGLAWIPPELREDRGEIEAALQQAPSSIKITEGKQGKQSGLPKLIELNNIKGDLHIHSDYDLDSSHDLGSSSLYELLDQAQKLNYEYIGISDHNPAVNNHSESEIVEILHSRREKLEQIYYSKENKTKNRVKIFIMLEVDIDTKGKLAIPDKAFNYIDAAIVSVHSSFRQSYEEMTKRILSGLSHSKAKIFGHPTGRLLGTRDGYEADWNKIFEFCVKNNKAMEINSWPERLDLPDLLVKDAINKGVKIVINTDSHAYAQMLNMKYGVSVARRGWAESQDILNTLSYNEFNRWISQ